MSHTSSVALAITSLDTVAEAVQLLSEMGVRCELKTNTEPRMWYQKQLMRSPTNHPTGIPDATIVVHDAFFDIGLIRQQDGTYSAEFDPYPRASPHVPGSSNGRMPLRGALGTPNCTDQSPRHEHIAKFTTAVGAVVARKALRAQGLTVSLRHLPDGSLRVVGVAV